MASNVLRLAVVAAVVALLAFAGSGAGAKTPAYVVTGGELGPYAAHFFGNVALPGTDARPVEPPGEGAIAYDLYASRGAFAVLRQIAEGGPWYQYYPELGVLHDLSTRVPPGVWFKLGPQTAAFLDGAIAEALAQLPPALEIGPIAADFRARDLPGAGFWLKPYPEGATQPDLERLTRLGVRNGAMAEIASADSETFVMEHLLRTVSSPPVAASGEPPAYVIVYGHGLLGFYSPAAGDRPGRFWDDAYLYNRDAAFWETTSGFDRTVAAALASYEPPTLDGSSSVGNAGGDSLTDSWLMWALMAAAVALVAMAAGSFGLARRRAGR